MHDIHLVLKKLTDYFSADEEVEALQARVSVLQHNINYDVLMNNFTEICTECRQTRESNVFDNTHDSWEYFSKIISIRHLVAFFVGLIELGNKDDDTNVLHKKLSITVCRTYVLLLTSPGAKIFDAFEPDLLQRIYKVFGILRKLATFKEPQRVQLQMSIIMLLQDFVLYLKHVSFQNYEELQTELIAAIANIMDYNHENGLNNKCKSGIFLYHSLIKQNAIFYRFVNCLQILLKSKSYAMTYWSTSAYLCMVKTYRRASHWC